MNCPDCDWMMEWHPQVIGDEVHGGIWGCTNPACDRTVDDFDDLGGDDLDD